MLILVFFIEHVIISSKGNYSLNLKIFKQIFFIDDNSTDNSSQIIKKLMNNSRNKAVLLSRDKYILIIDPDDFLLNNILIKCYEVAKKFNLVIKEKKLV